MTYTGAMRLSEHYCRACFKPPSARYKWFVWLTGSVVVMLCTACNRRALYRQKRAKRPSAASVLG